MKILLVLITSFSISSSLFSQGFEWLAYMKNSGFEISDSDYDAEHGLVTVKGIYFTSSKSLSKVLTVDSDGHESYCYDCYGGDYLIQQFTIDGKLQWTFSVDRSYGGINGISHDKDGNTVLLWYIAYYEDGKNKRDTLTYGYMPEYSEEIILTCHYLVTINNKGEIIKRVQVSDYTSDYSVNGFEMYDDDSYILYGTFRDVGFFPELGFNTANKQGNFFVVLDDKGQAEWGDIYCYTPKLGSSYGNSIGLAVAPDKTVYFSGTMKQGFTDKDGKGYNSMVHSEQNLRNPTYETYLSSYNKKGERQWLKLSGERAMYNAIYANNDGVFLSYYLGKDAMSAFGKHVDTTGNHFLITTGFDTKGNVTLTIDQGCKKMFDIKVLNDELYLLGHYSYMRNDGIIDEHQLCRRSSTYLAKYDLSGKLLHVKELTLPVSINSGPPFKLYISPDEGKYLCGSMWLGSSFDMWIYDELLRGVKEGGDFFIFGKLLD